MEQSRDMFQIEIPFIYVYAYLRFSFNSASKCLYIYGKTRLKEAKEESEAVLGPNSYFLSNLTVLYSVC